MLAWSMRAVFWVVPVLIVNVSTQACITAALWEDYRAAGGGARDEALARILEIRLIGPQFPDPFYMVAIHYCSVTARDQDWIGFNIRTDSTGWIWVRMEQETWERILQESKATVGASVILFLGVASGPDSSGRMSLDYSPDPTSISSPSTTIQWMPCTVSFRSAADAPSSITAAIPHHTEVPLRIWKERGTSSAVQDDGLWWRIALTVPALAADIALVLFYAGLQLWKW